VALARKAGTVEASLAEIERSRRRGVDAGTETEGVL
jgi:hypothetical protein